MGVVRILAAGMVLSTLLGCQMFSSNKSPSGVAKKPTPKSTSASPSGAKQASNSNAPRGANLDAKRPAEQQKTSWFGSLFKKKEEPKPQTVASFLDAKRPE
jgi:hypothetical protein